ncbi:helix-turn-helix domain-containing protein [Sneathiella sp.]|uniref:helix-turn-helix domain-containing protein n=1 Tax=Sneathiella sp. TaxID=1964365 RepID=UPI0035698EEF
MTSNGTITQKPTFAPLPARAIGDQRLTGLHFRVLAVICLHDRMSGARGKGQGCWASHKTLADKCGCNYTNLSTAIKELGEWGYVERSRHPMNKRQWVYRVIYTDDDKTIAKTPNSLPTDKQYSPEAGAIVCPDANSGDAIVCPDFREDSQYQDVSDVEYIPQSGEEITGTVKRNSVETALLCNGAAIDLYSDAEVGTFLRKAETRIKANDLSAQELFSLRDRLNEIEGCRDHADPLHQWARRLLWEVDDISPANTE